MVVGANTPQSIVEAPLGELRQARSRQHLWKADGDVREPPEVAAPQVIFQIHRLAPHNAQAALHQLHGTRQRQQTGFAGAGGLCSLAGVVELVKTNRILVARAGNDLLHHPTRGQAHGRDARVERQHLHADFFELGDVAMALAHQGHQGVVGRQGQLDGALQGLYMVARHICRLGALLRAFLPLQGPDQCSSAGRCQQKNSGKGGKRAAGGGRGG